jgi:hypothetical protein
MRRFQPGEHVTLREVWQGKIWTTRAVTVVHDRDDLPALYLQHGSPRLRPVSPDGESMRLPNGEWRLEPDMLYRHALRLGVPSERHSVFVIWDEEWRFRLWYINLEEPTVRTEQGFDYMDQTLDIVVSPDLSGWRWKDEDELKEAIDGGVYPASIDVELRSEGQKAAKRLLDRQPPLDQPWEDWRPDPAWRLPERPDAWDALIQQ